MGPEGSENMSEIKFESADVERVWSSAMKTKDRFDREGFESVEVHESMDLLVEFCDLLMGRGARTVDTFLSNNDMEIPQ
jgi:hypothetical protein